MAYLNKVMLMGNLGKDAEVRMTPSGKKKVSFTLATTQRFRDSATGEMRDKTEWHNIVAWNRAADSLERLQPKKGTALYVEGKVAYRSWDDPQSGQKRYITEIELDEFQFLGPRNTAGGAPQAGGAPYQGGSSYQNQNAGGYRGNGNQGNYGNNAPAYNNQNSGFDNGPDYDAPPAASGADDDLPF